MAVSVVNAGGYVWGVRDHDEGDGRMRMQRKLVAGLAAGLLAFGLAACEVDEEALDDLDDPGLEEGGGDL